MKIIEIKWYLLKDNFPHQNIQYSFFVGAEFLKTPSESIIKIVNLLVHLSCRFQLSNVIKYYRNYRRYERNLWIH